MQGQTSDAPLLMLVPLASRSAGRRAAEVGSETLLCPADTGLRGCCRFRFRLNYHRKGRKRLLDEVAAVLVGWPSATKTGCFVSAQNWCLSFARQSRRKPLR